MKIQISERQNIFVICNSWIWQRNLIPTNQKTNSPASIILILKSEKDTTRKENYRTMSLMNLDTIILSNILVNPIQEHIKIHDQAWFIPEFKDCSVPTNQYITRQMWYTILTEWRIKVIYMIISIDNRKKIDKNSTSCHYKNSQIII